MKRQNIHFSRILTSEKLDNIFYQYLNSTQNIFHMKCVWNTTAFWLSRFPLFARVTPEPFIQAILTKEKNL